MPCRLRCHHESGYACAERLFCRCLELYGKQSRSGGRRTQNFRFGRQCAGFGQTISHALELCVRAKVAPDAHLSEQPFDAKRVHVFRLCNGTQEIPVDWVSGACMVIRREVFDAVGGFDERFFLYWEDTDLCKRISAAGWRVVYYPKAEIKHQVGVSSSKSPVRSICHFHHSCLKLFEKHTRWPMRLFIPVTFMALAVRCFFAIILHLFNRTLAGERGCAR
jgi:GT2 family glycosyltransferase